MKKLRRVLALVGAILLIGMYLATMLLAIFGNADSKGWLMASIVMTVLIPVLLYAIQLVARVFSGKNQKEAFRKAYAIQLVARVFSGKNQKEAFRKAEAEQKASENKENKAGRRK